MAITIQQSPTYVNIANNNLVYVVTSTEISQPQYQFVLDIKDVNGTLIQRLKQQPNPSSKGVFDIGQIIANQFGEGYEYIHQSASLITNDYRASGSIPTTYYQYPSLNGGAVKQFNVLFGEEYGTSTTSTSSLYDGNGSLGNPAVTASNDWELYSNGVLDINTRFPKWDAGWNLTTEWDQYTANLPLLDSTTLAPTSSFIYGKTGKAKWAPQNIYGTNYFGTDGTDDIGFALTNPCFPAYSFNVGLTDFPVERTVNWDDYLTLSVLQGTEFAPDKITNVPPQSGSLYLPKSQWIGDSQLLFYRSDGAINSAVVGGNINLSFRGATAGEDGDPRWLMYSQSVEDTMLHFGVGPMNYSMDAADGTGTQIRNPIDYPSSYTTHVDFKAYGMVLSNGVSYSNNNISGNDRSGYELPKPGILGYGFSFPTVFLSAVGTDPTGSYNIGAEFTIRSTIGLECITRINYADQLYPGGPGSEYPFASPLAIQDCINRDMIASGSSARCFLIDNDDSVQDIWEVGGVLPDYTQFNILIMDDDVDTGYNYIMVLNPLGSVPVDALGLPIIGNGSGTGLGTGTFSSQGGGITYTQAAIPTLSTGSLIFNSTWENRTYNIDWSGYPGHYDACGYEKKQFVWVNKYGAYDYYTFTKAEAITDDIERKNYKQTFVDFASNSNTIDFNKSRRGNTQYYNKPAQRYRVESNWLTQEEADAVREMFFSTGVSILEKTITSQADYDFATGASGVPSALNLNAPQRMGTSTTNTFDQTQQLPIVVTNASITEKTNPRTQKLYRYTVEYQLANDLKSRV